MRMPGREDARRGEKSRLPGKPLPSPPGKVPPQAADEERKYRRMPAGPSSVSLALDSFPRGEAKLFGFLIRFV